MEKRCYKEKNGVPTKTAKNTNIAKIVFGRLVVNRQRLERYYE